MPPALELLNMNQPARHAGSPNRLAYRLRESVRIQATDANVQLILAYPLKTIRIHPHWHCLFECLSDRKLVSFDAISAITEHQNPAELEFFLNDLVRKGFLERQGISALSHYPFVSVIIPVRNRPEDIAACLRSLRHLDYPEDKLEIIVVDDASNDQTPEVVSRFPIRLLRLERHRQASYCRNHAARQAIGELLAFIDSDCLADSAWLQELVPAFNDKTLGAVGGIVDSYHHVNGLDRYEKVKSSLRVSSHFRRSEQNDPFFYLPSCNLLVRRDLFLRLGGFNEDLVVGEDVDLCWRMREQGDHIDYLPMGKIDHKHRNKLISFGRRRFDYGTSEPLLNRLHPEKIKQIVCPPLALVFWAGVILSPVLNYPPLLGVSAAALIADGAQKLFYIRKKSIAIKTSWLILSVLRGYWSLLYHIGSFVSRYYLFLVLIILSFAPAAAMVILGLHLTAGTVDYVITNPQLNLISFLFYFTWEQLSYQLGVWWGCFRTGCFRPVNPIVASKISG